MCKSQFSCYGLEAAYLYWKERGTNENAFMRKQCLRDVLILVLG